MFNNPATRVPLWGVVWGSGAPGVPLREAVLGGPPRTPFSAEHPLPQDSTWQRYACCTGPPGQVSDQTGTTLQPIASSVLLARPPHHSALPRSASSPRVLPAGTQHHHPPRVLQ